MDIKHITVFAGDSGSGKTTLALNYALFLKQNGFDTVLIDLDTVNTYFKAGMFGKILSDAEIELIKPGEVYDNLDSPAITAEMFRPIIEKNKHVVIDLGGTVLGAAALGRFAPAITESKDFNMVFTVNFFRPLTTTAKEAYDIMRTVEQSAGLNFTCIADNSNYGKSTRAADLENTKRLTQELCAMSGLKLIFTCVKEDIFSSFSETAINPFKLKIFDKQF